LSFFDDNQKRRAARFRQALTVRHRRFLFSPRSLGEYDLGFNVLE
jgi:hypothetical protein